VDSDEFPQISDGGTVELEYPGSLDEKLDDDARTVNLEAGKYAEGVCRNCTDQTFVKLVAGSLLCRMCAERYPQGLPF